MRQILPGVELIDSHWIMRTESKRQIPFVNMSGVASRMRSIPQSGYTLGAAVDPNQRRMDALSIWGQRYVLGYGQAEESLSYEWLTASRSDRLQGKWRFSREILLGDALDLRVGRNAGHRHQWQSKCRSVQCRCTEDNKSVCLGALGFSQFQSSRPNTTEAVRRAPVRHGLDWRGIP